MDPFIAEIRIIGFNPPPARTEAKDNDHTQWIQILAFNHGVLQP